jgi:hypothetical protein
LTCLGNPSTEPFPLLSDLGQIWCGLWYKDTLCHIHYSYYSHHVTDQDGEHQQHTEIFHT